MMHLNLQEETPTILIVDDNPNNIKIVALILRSLKYKIVIATNGEQAIDLVEQTRPDLILLDVMMPKMDGFEACSIIKSKEENANTPIIFITALNDTESLVKGFKAGGVDYITKPFNKDELISRVKTHLELKQTRDRLEKTTQHLSELNALKDKMFSVIGHDLRSPLSSVKMTLEFLSKMANKKDDPIVENINIMLKTTDEVFGLLENLLGWAKSQSGNLSINKEELLISEVVNSVYLLNKGNLELKEISFQSEVNENAKVFADLSTIKVVLRNLVSNAIKFTPENGTITISANENDRKTVITVADSGIGISEEDLPKILNPNTHHTTYGTNREAGSGLGLTLCKDFVEKNDGTIWVESEQGKGSTFFIEMQAGEN
ncbi:hybrid sensor histidine kinase/response regulator [uncultured Draconibacterium sp.]|uniref:hybrid sensor histidine kinase/response regulator n=1 Tax=uncultured Draconibacterium sp. TaxID=1573823 RepID=UPI002AA60C9E|nr:hybrid sensor histidine kinase/response regulator [uncultured Draconibacterium sp.]